MRILSILRGREKAFFGLESYQKNFTRVRGIVQIQKFRCYQLRLPVRVGSENFADSNTTWS